MPNWKTQDARDRLMAALVASIDPKALNYRRIASFFGEGTTYDAIEGQFRAIRKRAAELREEASSADGSVADPPSRGGVAGSGNGAEPRRRKAATGSAATGSGANKKAKKGPSPRRDGVLVGRVTKSKSITPTNLHGNKAASVGLGFENANPPAAGANAVKGFKQEIESSDVSAAGTPANSFGLLGYDGACDSFLSTMTYDLDFADSFAGFPSDDSYVFEA